MNSIKRNSYQTIKRVENFGKKIILDNDTEWEIYFIDSIKSLLWLPHSKVTVRDRNEIDSWKVLTNTIYPYTTIIEHVSSGKMVGAKKIK